MSNKYVKEWLKEDTYNVAYATVEQPKGMEIIAFVRDDGPQLKTMWWISLEVVRPLNVSLRVTFHSREATIEEARREVEDRIARLVALLADDVDPAKLVEAKE